MALKDLAENKVVERVKADCTGRQTCLVSPPANEVSSLRAGWHAL
jgi:hypothetical protein